MNINELQHYTESQKTVTIPDVQHKFALKYGEVRQAFQRLQDEGKIKFVGGLTFEWRPVEKTPTKKELDALEDLFDDDDEDDQPQIKPCTVPVDPLCKRALRFWLEKQSGRASIASLQRSLCVGFNRAGLIMDSLQKLGYVEEIGENDSPIKPVRVLVRLEDLDKIFPNLED